MDNSMAEPLSTVIRGVVKCAWQMAGGHDEKVAARKFFKKKTD